jgi:hypothetical protein
MAISTNTEPRGDARGRKSGDPMTPENAAPRPSTTVRRTGAVSGASLEPEAVTPRASGDAMETDMDSNVVAPVINGPSGDPGIKPIPTK